MLILHVIHIHGGRGTDLVHDPPDGSHPQVGLLSCVCCDEVRLVGACDTLTITASYKGRSDEDITVKTTVKFT